MALLKDGLQVDKNGCDARHLLQETHHYRDDDRSVVDGCGQLGQSDSTLCADAVLH